MTDTTEVGPQASVKFSASDREGWSVLAVDGEVDMLTSPSLREQLNELVRSGATQIVLDLSGVAFFDSSGLSAVVTGVKSVRHHGGSLRVVCTEPRVVKVFEIAGLTRLLPLHQTVEEAIAASED